MCDKEIRAKWDKNRGFKRKKKRTTSEYKRETWKEPEECGRVLTKMHPKVQENAPKGQIIPAFIRKCRKENKRSYDRTKMRIQPSKATNKRKIPENNSPGNRTLICFLDTGERLAPPLLWLGNPDRVDSPKARAVGKRIPVRTKAITQETPRCLVPPPPAIRDGGWSYGPTEWSEKGAAKRREMSQASWRGQAGGACGAESCEEMGKEPTGVVFVIGRGVR